MELGVISNSEAWDDSNKVKSPKSSPDSWHHRSVLIVSLKKLEISKKSLDSQKHDIKKMQRSRTYENDWDLHKLSVQAI